MNPPGIDRGIVLLDILGHKAARRQDCRGLGQLVGKILGEMRPGQDFLCLIAQKGDVVNGDDHRRVGGGNITGRSVDHVAISAKQLFPSRNAIATPALDDERPGEAPLDYMNARRLEQEVVLGARSVAQGIEKNLEFQVRLVQLN